MLHEVILALAGHAGQLIKETLDGRNRVKLSLADDVSFVSESERAIVDELAAVGAAHRQLAAFVELSTPRLYLRALQAGIDDVLESFRDAVCDVEEEVLAEGGESPLALLQYRLASYAVLLPELVSVVDDVLGRAEPPRCNEPLSLEGAPAAGAMFETLERRSVHGMVAIAETVRGLQHRCHHVMYEWLVSWLVYGMVTDAHGEFFIASKRLGRRTRAQSDRTETDADGDDDADGAADGDAASGFTLALGNLPGYIPTRVAEKVLFMGRATLIQQDRRAAQLSVEPAETVKFTRTLRQLQAHPFHAVRFEAAIDEMRATVSRGLRSLLIVGADLPGQLKAMKQYFLMANTLISFGFPVRGIQSRRSKILDFICEEWARQQ